MIPREVYDVSIGKKKKKEKKIKETCSGHERYNPFFLLYIGGTNVLRSYFHALIIDLNQVGSLLKKKKKEYKFNHAMFFQSRKKKNKRFDPFAPSPNLVSEFGTFDNRVSTFTVVLQVPQLF